MRLERNRGKQKRRWKWNRIDGRGKRGMGNVGREGRKRFWGGEGIRSWIQKDKTKQKKQAIGTNKKKGKKGTN